MKYILFIIAILASTPSLAASATDKALEAQSIRIEYYPSSGRGLVHVLGCKQCNKPYYRFSQAPQAKKQGKMVPFDTLLKHYWQAKYPTLLVDPQSLEVKRIVY